MWFNSDIFQKAQQAKETPKSKARREAVKIIEDSGKGVCYYCQEEIYKSDSSPGGGWIWESAGLVGYCDKSPTESKHRPMVKYLVEKGIINVQPL